MLGLGVQARGYVRGWHGQKYRKPIDRDAGLRHDPAEDLRGRARDATTARCSRSRTSISTWSSRRRRSKIYIAANGPRMVELAGEIADGTVGWFHSLEYVRDVTMPALRRGAERARTVARGLRRDGRLPGGRDARRQRDRAVEGARDDVRDRARLRAGLPRQRQGGRVRRRGGGDRRARARRRPPRRGRARAGRDGGGDGDGRERRPRPRPDRGVSRGRSDGSPSAARRRPAAITRCTRATSRSSRSRSCRSSTSRR